ncbi:alpha-N-arabinofuranosidase [Dysgonomonas sp. PFB1-18]|uniref:alpha-L-arabinofuranosidase C-terminal domain-containing protein n=1 Tax=unclassified Dysgonomonas TaxID=2630389 RepID=UPI0024737B85|nr:MULTISPECIES: alpha-L-arabinofuranosidase C-terminal domain-containing protein [unclassified Dysgonomonas]MDH6308393.1 alpha-N-arabinofuranosidase [Dysgonomonas sp. PF1-14]MDH6338170.1 alpha-N-arabinofuranosidase [Dysgonomonas sp. PF1-16]MDH6379667.1 alpha-N-arabinofuranosidase [Dysgonomonas sp. PFB1-18]MDH6397244.1 alpha-N-arabinofuranosidase [Dysgonomonas sp. PF1-23]
MKKKLTKILSLAALLAFGQVTTAQQSYEFELDTKKVGAPIQSTMYGLFFEDINFAADGGLYAELVKNRSFDFPQSLMGWYTFGKVEVTKNNPLFDRNPNYVVLSDPGHAHKRTGIENEGFRGMGFKKDATYRFSVWAKNVNATGDQKIRVELINPKSDIIGSADLTINSSDWKKYQITITSKVTEEKGRLRIFLASGGSVALEHISLFPTDTYKGRENGLRKDLAQALADIHPGVFRFPGGCIVEGTDLDSRYDWKKSVGPVENRPLNENRWHYTFPHRFFPDYFQSYGLGFYEYFLLSEDMGAEPLPVLSCGLACQFQNEDEHCHVPVGELDPYIQDALDLIEFANGAVTSTWGKVRADMGHPEPFNLKYIGIGNEQWGKEYPERLEPFVKAIRAKYPDIKIIGSSGPSADGKEFDYLWPEMKRIKVDLVDEHYYKEPNWFLSNASRYDNYDRKGPAVFAGEYASHDHSTGKQNNFLSALTEAAFMTGLERNADIVHMCTYAPLFAHVEAWQWNPDMIWFDNLRMMKTPNYYIQQLYAYNKGTNVMTLTRDKKAIAGDDNLYASAVFDKDENCYIVKVANTGTEAKDIKVTLTGGKKNATYTVGDCVMMQNNDLKVINTLDAPSNIVPQKTSATINGNILSVKAPAQSFNLYKIKL